ncbi:acid-sensing ion channel 1A-like [Dysidea avara]|uniref:acid-sensing ion channel 1A-like n=1 Tax=Dysidea avara TaxID=196820 RepID=UPI0033228282
MTDQSVDLLRVTSTSITENGAAPGANHCNTDNFVKCLPVKLAPINHHQGDNISERSSICKDAWQDENAILASARSCHSVNSCQNLLDKVPLSDSHKELANTWRMKVWRTLFRFFLNSSFHGLPHIASSNRSWGRLTYWIIVFLLSLLIMLAAIYFVTAQYAEMKTILFSKQYPHKSLPFPAITICNLNTLRGSVVSDTNLSLTDLAIVFNLISDDPWLSETFDIDAYFDKHEDVFGVENSSFFYNNSGHQLENMLFSCRLGNRSCSTANFTQRSSINGNCYTFNSGENEPISTVRRPGRRSGLSLVLNAEQYEYFLAESDSIGFNIFIHHPDHFPYFGAVGSFSIPTGQLTRVALNKVDYKLSTTSCGGQCEDNINLKHFKTYEQQSCLAECVTDIVVNMCNCKPEYLPGPAEVCKLNNSCQYDALNSFNLDNQCNCPPACEYSLYTKTLSYATFPASHFVSILNISSSTIEESPSPEFVVSTTMDENGTEKYYLNENFTESFLSKNFAQVQIYYDSLTTTTMEEGLEYSTYQFLVDFGGYIGLFTGAGFLTLFELLDFCFSFVRPIED